MKSGALDLAAITTLRVPFGRALEVYRDLVTGAPQNVGVVLEYEAVGSIAPEWEARPAQPPAARLDDAKASLLAPVQRLDVIGAGNFARTMLLPHLKGVVPFGTVVNNTSLSADHVKRKFGFSAAATDYTELYGSDAGSPAAVLIATRHHLHAELVLSALAANRHVFVEKPLCLTRAELGAIDDAVAKSSGSVQVGFNRRFAPASQKLLQLLRSVPGPKTASFRVVAGPLDPQQWYANYAESGGRILGEACHFLDYFCFLFGSRPVRVLAQTIWPPSGRLPFPDSVTAQVEFADGSCGQLIYTAEGDSGWPKEQCTVYGAGLVAEIINFQDLTLYRGRKRTKFSYAGKGHAEQVAAWAAFLRGAAEHPLSYEQSRQSMMLTFATLESIQQGHSVEL